MQQHSNLSERKYLDSTGSSETHWTTPSGAEALATTQTEMQLKYDQCLNRLGQRLNEIVTACLSETANSQGEVDIAVDLGIFQAIADELAGVLVDTTVIALQGNPPSREGLTCREGLTLPVPPLSESMSSDSNELHSAQSESCASNLGEFRICHIVPKRSSTSQPKISWTLSSGKPFCPVLAARLTLEDLQSLQIQAPEAVWQMGNDLTPWGWLLVHSGSASTGELSHPTDSLSSGLIQQSIRQGVMALHQISLIHAHCQQRQQLCDRNRELLQTNQLKSEFLANTSHEIRTPLSSILGFTHLLQAQGFSPMNLRHQEYLNIILTSGQHLLSLINDILDLSKIEANQLDLQWETVDVRNLCQMVMTLVKEKASDKGLKTHLEVAPSVTTLMADGLRLKQMLFNLLSNAIKFTLEGDIGIEAIQADNFLHFTVWDTGTGISQEQQHLLFRPYCQLANVATDRGEGTGLGLALTQKLAELHGGWVEIRSEIDQGSRFTIVLPLVPPSPLPQDLEETETVASEQRKNRVQHDLSEKPATQLSSGREEALSSAASQRVLRPTNRRKKKLFPQTASSSNPQSLLENRPEPIRTLRPNHLMLVEDNIHNAKLMLTFLSKSGYEVTWVQDGREMWQALERSLPALILMDIHLPEVDGLTLTRQLKQNDRYQSIPVIAQTALAMKGDRGLCLEAGAVDYISKPIDLDVLAKMVKQVLGS